MRSDVTAPPAERTLRRRGRVAQRDPGPRTAARRDARTGLLPVSPALASVAVFRTMIFLPYISGLVPLCFMAVVELQPDSGTANFVLAKLGIAKATTAWLVHTGLALTAISIMVIWFAAGFTMMLLMAGMQAIPQDIYESARVDGASWWSAEWNLTVPLLRRSIALSLIVSVVYSFLAFNQFFIMTDGGPGTSTESVVMAIFQTAFADMNVGLASAMSVVLVVVIGLITFVQFRVLQGDAD